MSTALSATKGKTRLWLARSRITKVASRTQKSIGIGDLLDGRGEAGVGETGGGSKRREEMFVLDFLVGKNMGNEVFWF